MCALHRKESTRLAAFANHSFSTAEPMCQLDYFFLNRCGDTDILTVQNFLHCPSGASLAQCRDKGPANHVVQAVTTFMDFLELKKMCFCEPMENGTRVLQRKQSRLLETTRHSWKRRHDARVLRWVLLSAAIEVYKVRSDACGSLSRRQQTSPLVSRTISSSVSADMRVGSSRDFTCRLMDSLLTSDSNQQMNAQWSSTGRYDGFLTVDDGRLRP